MERRFLDTGLAIAPQLNPDDVPVLAESGFRSIVCNRPDDEGEHQPSHDAIAAAAHAAGLQTGYLPVVAGGIDDADVERFGAMRLELPAPVLAYCRTGTRAAMLWALDEAPRRAAAELVRTASEAGVDISGLADRLTERHVGQ